MGLVQEAGGRVLGTGSLGVISVVRVGEKREGNPDARMLLSKGSEVGCAQGAWGVRRFIDISSAWSSQHVREKLWS